MAESIIIAEGLGKRYRLGAQSGERYTALRDVIADKAKGLFRRNGTKPPISDRSSPTSETEFWALKDVSFEVRRGEVLGIIGRNGAGKSTLLKILSRITDPTEGKVRIKGRVASLLEVGTGFHPELTGRENIYLNGAILGMSKAEIKAKFDEIVAFAEVEKFLDTPVKRYSSGMYVRLAFAVAAHLEPEILVVDEVLAVGDAEFQKKCLGKMEEVSRGGRTVLFVSHNMGAINSLCSRALLLSQARLAMDAVAHVVSAAYLRTGRVSERYVAFPAQLGSKLSFTELAILDRDGSTDRALDIGSEIQVRICYNISTPLVGAVVGIRVRRDGILLFNSFDTDEDPERLGVREPGYYQCTLTLPKLLLGAGKYVLSVLASVPRTEAIAKEITDAISFELQETSQNLWFKSYAKERGGMLILPIKWKVSEHSRSWVANGRGAG